MKIKYGSCCDDEQLGHLCNKCTKKLEKVMTILYELEDDTFYMNKPISKAINLLQKVKGGGL